LGRNISELELDRSNQINNLKDKYNQLLSSHDDNQNDRYSTRRPRTTTTSTTTTTTSTSTTSYKLPEYNTTYRPTRPRTEILIQEKVPTTEPIMIGYMSNADRTEPVTNWEPVTSDLEPKRSDTTNSIDYTAKTEAATMSAPVEALREVKLEDASYELYEDTTFSPLTTKFQFD